MAEINFPGGSVVKNLPDSAGNTENSSLIPESVRYPGGGNGNLCQYSCLENPVDRRAWWAAVHGGHKELDTTERLNNNSNIKG